MSDWLTDPELFLYAKGTGPDDIHLWRCKKPASSSSSSSLVVPMKSNDFDYVSNVKNHLELIGDLFDWDETDYKRLVKYIFERRLLVNGQGFVIAELLHKADKDGNKMIDDANEEVPIYIRSLDVLPLKPYIPKLRERAIPSRVVRYLGDVNGKAAMMEEKDFNVTKLTARVADLEAENVRLESKTNTLDTNLTKLIPSLATLKDKVADLESKNKTLEGKVTKLTVDLATQTNANYKEVWMNDLTNNEWVGIEGLRESSSPNVVILSYPGSFTVDDNSTNVRARYWFKIKPHGGNTYDYKAVTLDQLTPNKEKARFSQKSWPWSFTSQEKIWIFGPV